MGYAGVVQYAGLRIAGISGIFKQHDYTMGHYEHPPYSESSKRSVYHVRNLEVFRLGQLRHPVDIVLSHDWPRGIYHYGDTKDLLRHKPHFADEVNSDALGSPPAEQLLCHLRPRYWFSAHLHCKFAAVVQHCDSTSDQPQITRFLALDKCLARRDYLQFVDIEAQSASNQLSSFGEKGSNKEASEEVDDLFIVSRPSSAFPDSSNLPQNDEDNEVVVTNLEEPTQNLFLDPEWLCILQSTNHLMSTAQVPCILPGRNAHERCDFSATVEQIRSLHDTFGNDFTVPDNFERTAPIYKPDDISTPHSKGFPRTLAQQAAMKQQPIFSNPQTELLCAMLDLINPNALLLGRESYSLQELSSLLKEKKGPESEDEGGDVQDTNEHEEEQNDDDSLALPAGGLLDHGASWVSSTYSQSRVDASEYDPLDSVCMSPRQQLNMNPSQGELSSACQGEYRPEIEEGEEQQVDKRYIGDSCHILPGQASPSSVNAYSPQPFAIPSDDKPTDKPVVLTDEIYYTANGADVERSLNSEEIPLPSSSDDDDTT
ncbi:unnamed protein product [Dicrocoelium dendriticum]|nr:unnamed protein product [Dicrocoelium dendriticum]